MSVALSAPAVPAPAVPAPAVPAPAVSAPAAPDLRIVGRADGTKPADFARELGDVLTLELRGAFALAARAELAKGAAGEIKLHLANVAMTGLVVEALDPQRDGLLRLSFALRRDSAVDENRTAWNDLFERQTDYVMKLPVSLSLGSAPPVGALGPDSISFQVADPRWITGVSWAAVALFVLVFALLIHWPPVSNMLRDELTGRYSLGRAQMAFWGLLVFFAVLTIFVVMGKVEQIPTQTLTLLGISGATGLAATLIDRRKAADGGERIKALKATPSRGFFWDIVDDGNGPSFHRLQVVAWTFLLGGVFAHSVSEVVSMPVFPETLLLLMGISNGTYLGFKLPE